MQRASAAGDIGTLMRLVATTASLTPADFIKKTVGNLLFMYYMYLEQYHTIPMDIDDLIDGILAMEARNYVRRQAANGR